jgi:large subunit ribosomal protein L22
VIRGKTYEDALLLCQFMPYRACEHIQKVLLSVGACMMQFAKWITRGHFSSVASSFVPWTPCPRHSFWASACLTSTCPYSQAGANAKNNKKALKSKLVVSECFADQGPYLKRMRPRAKGR